MPFLTNMLYNRAIYSGAPVLPGSPIAVWEARADKVYSDSGTTLVTTDGSLVRQVNPASGSNVLNSSVDAKRPYLATGLGGGIGSGIQFPCLTQNVSMAQILAATTGPTSTTNFTLGLSLSINSLIYGGVLARFSGIEIRVQPTGSTCLLSFYTIDLNTATFTNTGVSVPVTNGTRLVVRSSAGSLQFKINGTDNSSVAFATNSGTADTYFGGRGNDFDMSQYTLHSAVLYNSVLSDADATSLDTYLRWAGGTGLTTARPRDVDIGNSIVTGFTAIPYSEIMAATAPTRQRFGFAGVGAPGSLLDSLSATWLPRIGAGASDWVRILEGTNDIQNGLTGAQAAANIESIRAKCLAAGAQNIIVMTMPWNNRSAQDAERAAFNAAILANYGGSTIATYGLNRTTGPVAAGKDRVYRMDLRFPDGTNLSDGVHPTTTGQNFMATDLAAIQAA